MESHLHEMTASELAAEKKKDYRNILIAQFFVVLIYFTLEDFLELLGLPEVIPYKNFVFLIAAGAYFFLLWDMMRNFTDNKLLLRGALALLVVNYVMGTLGENPFYPVISNPRPHYMFLHSTLMLIEWIVIGFAVKDLFTGLQTTSDKLWCSAALYLMIGITFGSMYDLLNIVQPGSFGKPVPVGFNSYIEGIYYSLRILGSGEPPYDSASTLHNSLAVLQAVWNNLYLVLLIGRILVLPDPKGA